jgi:hypothetical protein
MPQSRNELVKFIMKTKYISLLIVLFGLLISISCSNDETKKGIQSPIIGIGPVMKHFGVWGELPATVPDMMSKMTEVGDMILAQSGWHQSGQDYGELPNYFNDLVNIWPTTVDPNVQYGHVSYGINFFDQGTGVADLIDPVGLTNNWMSNPNDAKAKYRQVALALCGAPYNAKYIALALEVNTYCHYDPADYLFFIENVYIPIYDAIKATHPDTKVFVTFQLEQCKGIGAATWGYVPSAHWSLLDNYNGKLDLIAFTTYPEFGYSTPADIPNDYFTSIKNNLPGNLKNKPLAFVEMGWSDKNGNAGSQQAQIDFLNRFLVLTEGLKVEYMNWVFMHDMELSPLNDKLKLGLRDYNGNARPIWNEWKELKDSY